MKLAELSLQASITRKSNIIPGYVATELNNFAELAGEVANDVGLKETDAIHSGSNIKINTEGYTVVYYLDTPGSDSIDGIGYIVIWYTDNSLRSNIDRDEAISKYGIVDIAEQSKSRNQTTLVATIAVENYDSGLSETGLTSTQDGKSDISKEYFKDTSLGDQFAKVEVKEPGLYVDGVMTKTWQELKDAAIVTYNERWGYEMIDGPDDGYVYIKNNELYTVGYKIQSTSIAELVISAEVKSIASGEGFEEAESLNKITILGNLDYIGEDAFSECEAEEVIIDGNVTIAKNEAFRYSNIKNITINGNIQTIEQEVGGYSLKKFTVNGNVENINEEAFSFCEDLTDFTITGTLGTIRTNAFFNCTNLSNISINGKNMKIIQENDVDSSLTELVLNGDILFIGDYAFDNNTNLTRVIINGSVDSIGESAFERCSNLESVTITGTVTNIEECAFSNCSALTNFSTSGGIIKIGDYTFNETGLTEFNIPDGIKTIEEGAFWGTKLTNVTIPNSVTSMGEGVFTDCNNLNSINVKGYTTKPDTWDDNWDAKNWDDNLRQYNSKHTVNWNQ